MNPDVALPDLASSRTVQVGAKYFVRVQVVCSFGFFLVKDPKASAMNPLIVKNHALHALMESYHNTHSGCVSWKS
jgi:hypothetical protein